jgi:hypothetical protein
LRLPEVQQPVARRADDEARFGERLERVDWPGRAEVEELDAPGRRFEPDVRGLDVAVDQAGGVGHGQPFGDLAGDAQRLGHGERALALQAGLQGIALEELHRQERPAALLADLVDGRDMVVRQRRGQAGFLQEALAEGVLRPRQARHLDRQPPVQHGVLGLEDDTHAALAQDAQHAVAAQATQLVRPERRVEKIERLFRSLRVRLVAGRGRCRLITRRLRPSGRGFFPGGLLGCRHEGDLFVCLSPLVREKEWRPLRGPVNRGQAGARPERSGARTSGKETNRRPAEA